MRIIKNTSQKNLPEVLFDYQIFFSQKFGGVSRYFYELIKNGGGLYNYNIGGIFRINEYIKELNLPTTLEIEELKAQIDDNSKLMIEVNRADSIMKAENCDIYHPTYYETYYLGKIKKPLVLTVYDFIHEKFPELNLVYHRETLHNKKTLIERANRIIAISENTKQDLLRFYPSVKEENVSVIHLGTSFENKSQNLHNEELKKVQE